MLVNMFVGQPPGNYDRLLDYSRAVTGTLFFAPSATFLENVAAGVAAPSITGPTSNGRENEAKCKSQLSPLDGSLGIGSLKKGAGHE
jgi:putative iron-dependent peroxidase